jgi:hypothetical protein
MSTNSLRLQIVSAFFYIFENMYFVIEQASDEPAFLSKGVEVSAKYRGAFCEAKVTNVEKCVKCKVRVQL